MSDFSYDVEKYFNLIIDARSAKQYFSNMIDTACQISSNETIEKNEFTKKENLIQIEKITKDFCEWSDKLDSSLSKIELLLSSADKEIFRYLNVSYGNIGNIGDINVLKKDVADDVKKQNELKKQLADLEDQMKSVGRLNHNEYNKLKEQKVNLQQQIIELDNSIQNKKYKLIKAEEFTIRNTKEYRDFVKNKYSLVKDNPIAHKYYDKLPKEDKITFMYLLSKEGSDKAYEYLNVKVNPIVSRENEQIGKAKAEEFLKTLSSADEAEFSKKLESELKTIAQGSKNGLEGFGENILNNLTNSRILSDNEYEMLYISAGLEEIGYTKGYDLGTMAGTVLPSITASLVISLLGAPTVGTNVGIAMTSASESGKARKDALENGSSEKAATEMQAYKFVTSAAIAKGLNEIPYFKSAPDLSVKGLAKEGLRGVGNVTADAFGNYIILDKDIDISTTSEEALKVAAKNMLASALINGSVGGANKIKSVVIKDSSGAQRSFLIDDLENAAESYNSSESSSNIGGSKPSVKTQFGNSVKSFSNYEAISLLDSDHEESDSDDKDQEIDTLE